MEKFTGEISLTPSYSSDCFLIIYMELKKEHVYIKEKKREDIYIKKKANAEVAIHIG